MPHRDRRSSGGQKNSPPRPRPPLRARRVLRRARSSARPAAAACAKSREKSRRVWRREPRFPTYTAPSPGPCWSFPQPPRAGNGPCGPPAVSRGRPLRERRLWSSGGQEPSRPRRRQVEMARVTLPDGRLGPSSLTTHTRLSGRPKAAVTAATVPLAQYSASSNPAARSTVVHSHRDTGVTGPRTVTLFDIAAPLFASSFSVTTKTTRGPEPELGGSYRAESGAGAEVEAGGCVRSSEQEARSERQIRLY